MKEYSEAELFLCMLALPLDESGRTEKALCRKLLQYECLKPDAVPSAGQLTSFTQSREQALKLLSRKAAAVQALRVMQESHITAITLLSPEYPQAIRMKMGKHAPLLLFCCGNHGLFQKPCISLVGSRKLSETGRAFSAEAGRQISAHGYVYCSGGAKGADSVGFEHAIGNGAAILFLPGSLKEAAQSEQYRTYLEQGRLLLVSEDGYDLHFTAARALSRNHLIHAMGDKTLVAQTDVGKGGTWKGSVDNLKHHYSPVFVCAEQENAAALVSEGAVPVTLSALEKLELLTEEQLSMA